MAGSFSIIQITPPSFPILCTMILLLLGCGSARSQAVVTTLDGFVFRGKILSRGLDSLKMLTVDSQRVTLSNLQILSIEEERETRESPYAHPPPEPRAPDAQPFAGIVMSSTFMDTPSVNIFAGVRLNRFGARLVGMLDHGHGEVAFMRGGEFDLLLNLLRRDHTSCDIFVGMGVETDSKAGGPFGVWLARRRFTSVGIAANMAGLYIGGEISVGKSDTFDVQVLMQVGIAVEAGLKTIFDL